MVGQSFALTTSMALHTHTHTHIHTHVVAEHADRGLASNSSTCMSVAERVADGVASCTHWLPLPCSVVMTQKKRVVMSGDMRSWSIAT